VWLQRSWKKEQLVAQGKEHTEKEKGTEPEKPKDRASEPPPKDQPKPEDDDEKTDPNDRFGDPLPFGAIARMGSVRLKFASQLQQLQFSPNGRLLASAEANGTLNLWKVTTGELIHRIKLPPLPIPSEEPRDSRWQPLAAPRRSLAFSPDSKKLATNDGIYDLKTGARTVFFGEGDQMLDAVAFSPEGTTLAKVKDFGIRLLNVEKGTQETAILRIDPKKERIDKFGVVSLVYAPDGKSVAGIYSAIDGNKKVGNVAFIQDLTNAKNVAATFDLKGLTTSIAFSKDGKTLILGDGGGPVQTVNLENRKEIREFDKVGKGVVFVAEGGEDKAILVAVTADGEVVGFNYDKKEKLRFVLRKPRTPAFPIFALAPDGDTLAVARMPNRIELWSLTGRAIKLTAEGHQAGVMSVVFSPNGRDLVTSSLDRTVRRWNTRTGQEQGKPLQTSEAVSHLSLSSDGKRLATVSDRMQMWAWPDATTLSGYDDVWPGFRVASFAPSGSTFLMIGSGVAAQFWDADTAKRTMMLDRQKIAKPGGSCVAFSRDGTLVAVGSEPSGAFIQSLYGLVAVWNTQSGKLLREFGGHPYRSESRIKALAFTPDAASLVYAENKSIVLCNVETGEPYQWFVGHEGPVTCLTVSFDGRILVSASEDGTVRMWEILTGREIRRLEGHQQHVTSLAVSGDGRRLASGSMDGTALIWQIDGPVTDGPRSPTDVSDNELDRVWNSLGADNPQVAYRAIASMTYAPKVSVAYLEKQLAYETPNSRKLDQLLKDLLDEIPPECDQAYQELAELEGVPEDAVRDALTKSPSDFTRKRVEKLIEYRETGMHVTPTGNRLRIFRALAVLELIATDDAKAILQSLAKGNPKDPVVREAKAVLGRMSR
jgi:WD40 repeat protein